MGLAIAENYDDAMDDDEHRDGRYERLKEFQKVKTELIAIQKAQNDIADSVFQNLEYFTSAEEKQEIILTLRTELAEEASAHAVRKSELSEKIAQETMRLKDEIKLLIGTDEEQGILIKKLSHDLNDVYQGQIHAMKILSNRFQVHETDVDMQQELLSFVNSIERAERTYRSLTSLLEIANDIQTTEEKLENLMVQHLVQSFTMEGEPLQNVFGNIVKMLKGALHSVKEWKDSQKSCLHQLSQCKA